jgi:hypothetical protein
MDNRHLSFKISFPSLNPFLDHWASRYRDPERRDQKLYDPHIGTANLRTDFESLEALFTWKNGRRISEPKLTGIRTNYFDHWTEDSDLESRYLVQGKGGGPIWNIFYLHCRRPDLYQIYDQHTHRAMRYIEGHAICNKTLPPRCIYESYKQTYRPFVRTFDRDQRTIDRALYTFGQFLKLVQPFCIPNSDEQPMPVVV